MPTTIQCTCGKRLKVPDALMGKKAKCPNCKQIIQIPRTDGASETKPASGKTAFDTPQDLFEAAIHSVVGISCQESFGSGVIIGEEGIIATNRHVVGTNNTVTVKLNDGSEHPGRLVRSFRDIDLSFVLADFEKAKPAVLAQETTLKIGQPVYALGHPRGLQNTLTKGIVSSMGREIRGAQYIQTDAPINPGNSGGPLLNEYAEVVGINTMIMREAQGIGFAIPAQSLRERFEKVRTELAHGPGMLYCGICGHNSQEGKYCSHCGARFEEAKEAKKSAADAEPRKTCGNCGVDAGANDQFCANCGAKLRGV